MQPIHELLSRIRWDKAFAAGEFVIGYFDRVENRIIRVHFQDIAFPSDEGDTFQVADEEGHLHRIPYHRVKEVYKDGELIWLRTH